MSSASIQIILPSSCSLMQSQLITDQCRSAWFPLTQKHQILESLSQMAFLLHAQKHSQKILKYVQIQIKIANIEQLLIQKTVVGLLNETCKCSWQTYWLEMFRGSSPISSGSKPDPDEIWLVRWCSHKSINNESEVDKSQKDNIKLIIARKNTTKSFEAAKEPLHLITLFVQLLIIAPRIFAIAFWRNDRHIAKLLRQSPCLVPFIGPIHQKINRMVNWAKLPQKGAPFWSITAVSCG